MSEFAVRIARRNCRGSRFNDLAGGDKRRTVLGEIPTAKLEGACLVPDRMVLCVGIGGVGSDDVANPTESSTGADPETRGDNEPDDAPEDSTVVELADTGNKEAKKSCGKWIAHRIKPSEQTYTTASLRWFRENYSA